MTTICRDGATIAFTDTGAPSADPAAPTIVFGHGLLFSGWMFDAQIEVLRHRYRCVAIDWRGQGRSPAAPSGYSMDALYGDAVAVVEHLGVGAVHWVGLSMGGFVGMRLAARRPDLVASLTLLNTSADGEVLRAMVEDEALAMVVRLAGIAPVRGAVVNTMFGSAFRSSPRSADLIEDWMTQLSQCDRAALASAIHAVVVRQSVAAELRAITAPTLVVSGADDKPTPPKRGRAIAAQISNARFVLLDNCGHSSTLERPEAVTRLIGELVAAQ
ncbi:alpha/beta fold hydrolase [Rhodococcus sp. 077-4]|uniref:alpha/beta fold hydrolase n=1 Tax=Rhodococcus sp. 077-4 TaxID=2789271 RepID=UPI0039F627AF